MKQKKQAEIQVDLLKEYLDTYNQIKSYHKRMDELFPHSDLGFGAESLGPVIEDAPKTFWSECGEDGFLAMATTKKRVFDIDDTRIQNSNGKVIRTEGRIYAQHFDNPETIYVLNPEKEIPYSELLEFWDKRKVKIAAETTKRQRELDKEDFDACVKKLEQLKKKYNW